MFKYYKLNCTDSYFESNTNAYDYESTMYFLWLPSDLSHDWCFLNSSELEGYLESGPICEGMRNETYNRLFF